MRGPVHWRPDVARALGGDAAPLDNRILRFRLLAILAAQLFDFATFTVMVERHGIRAELNPLVVNSFHSSGLLGLLIIKLALVTLVSCATILLGRGASPVNVTGPFQITSRLATFITVLAVVAGLFGGWTNYITI